MNAPMGANLFIFLVTCYGWKDPEIGISCHDDYFWLLYIIYSYPTTKLVLKTKETKAQNEISDAIFQNLGLSFTI